MGTGDPFFVSELFAVPHVLQLSLYLSENPNSSFLQETDEDHALLCEEEVALDLEVGRLNRDGTPRMFPACSKPKRKNRPANLLGFIR